jgi:hypothetical protein
MAACLGVAPKTSQAQSRVTMSDFATGGEYESYLRTMQIAGAVPLYPWSIRGFSRREIERLAGSDSAGPWRLRGRLDKANLAVGPLTLGATFNSAFPYGANDGALWAGRGLTFAASGALSGHLGPLSFSLAPMAFRAANGPFALLSNGKSGTQSYNSGGYSDIIDLPQRFGSGSYSRTDPGNSYIRFDSRLLAAGVSSANEWIGPATEYPFLLGTNAPGFPHVFLGTGDPVNVWLGRIQARVLWGKLHQSEHSPVTGSEHFVSSAETGTIRLATAAQMVLVPRGVPGLELGFARFLHVPYGPNEPSSRFWRKPFKVFFLENEFAQNDSTGPDNQLVSVFFRWVFPRANLEIYGERGYDDQFYDLREFIANVDHNREYMLGLQKVLNKSDRRTDVLKVELINYQLSTLSLVRIESPLYVHSTLRQGHTNRGQLLGAGIGVWSAASVFAWTRYTARKRTAFTFRRVVRDQRGNFDATGVFDFRSSDVQIVAGAEQTRLGRFLDIGAKAAGARNLNRNFSNDVSNLTLEITARLHR